MGKPSRHIVYSEFYQTEAKSFYDYLCAIGYGEKNCRTKYLSLKDFFSFLESRQVFELKAITAFEVSEFYQQVKERTSLRTDKPLQKKSMYDKMRSIQLYFAYLLDLHRIKINPASHLKFRNYKERPERRVFTQNEIFQLYKMATSAQERAILHTAYGCGLRASEVSNLNKDDLHVAENLLVVQKGKNNKRRIVPVNETVMKELRHFIFSTENKNETENKTDFVFYNQRNERMQIGTLNSRLKDIIKRTDFGKQITKEEMRKIGMHSLRHSIATHLLENGMKLEQVRDFLGHSQVETTEIYTHVNQTQIKDLYNDNQGISFENLP